MQKVTNGILQAIVATKLSEEHPMHAVFTAKKKHPKKQPKKHTHKKNLYIYIYQCTVMHLLRNQTK